MDLTLVSSFVCDSQPCSGIDDVRGMSGNLQDVFVYDVETDTWSQVADFPTARTILIQGLYTGWARRRRPVQQDALPRRSSRQVDRSGRNPRPTARRRFTVHLQKFWLYYCGRGRRRRWTRSRRLRQQYECNQRTRAPSLFSLQRVLLLCTGQGCVGHVAPGSWTLSVGPHYLCPGLLSLLCSRPDSSRTRRKLLTDMANPGLPYQSEGSGGLY
jgi:hypothetical protein